MKQKYQNNSNWIHKYPGEKFIFPLFHEEPTYRKINGLKEF